MLSKINNKSIVSSTDSNYHSNSSSVERVAVTGANGFVGTHLVRMLAEKGIAVTALVRPTSEVNHLPSNIKIVSVDYDNKNRLKQVLAGHSCLIHNAAITKGRNWGIFFKHNVELTAKLVEAVNQVSTLQHLIFVSSQAASGCSVSPKKEDEECCPVSYYGKSKHLAENVVKEKCLKNWTIVRPCSVYGPGDRDFFQYFKLIKKGLSFIVGYKKKYISLIYVEQLTEYILRIINNPITFGNIYFLSDGFFYSWEDFIFALEGVIGNKTTRIRIPDFMVITVAMGAELFGSICRKTFLLNWQKSKEIRAYHWICDSTNAQNLLGKEFPDSLKDNLTKTYRWYKENKWL